MSSLTDNGFDVTSERRMQDTAMDLGAGLSLLVLIHLLHRIDNTFMALHNITTMQHIDLTVLVIGQYLVPVLVLIYLLHGRRQEIIIASENPV